MNLTEVNRNDHKEKGKQELNADNHIYNKLRSQKQIQNTRNTTITQSQGNKTQDGGQKAQDPDGACVWICLHV